MAKTPLYFGKYRAFVVDVDDPLKMGRIRVNCPQVTGGITNWCMPCISSSYDNGGDFHFPKVGEVVFIEFEEGDIKYPIYTGGWFTQGTCPLPNYDPDLRIISWGDNVIYMEKGKLTVKNGKSEVVLNNEDVEINAASEVNISGSKNININTPSEISLSGEGTVHLNSNSSLSITSPDNNMTFENGEMHFVSKLGRIDIIESGIEIEKDGSKAVFDGSNITLNDSRIIVGEDCVTISAYDKVKGNTEVNLNYDLIEALKSMGG